MPTLSYPGVYVEEIPSGVRTITGVATSITAFLGRTPLGPTGKPTTIFSFGDFQRQFGGLGFDCPMTYAVSDFFQNGGGQAIVVRLFNKAKIDASTSTISLADGVTLKAISPGAWSSGLTAVVDGIGTGTTATQLAQNYGLAAADLFNLALKLTVNGQVVAQEKYINCTVKDVPAARGQRLDRQLAQSQLVLVQLGQNVTTPKAGGYAAQLASTAAATPAQPAAAGQPTAPGQPAPDSSSPPDPGNLDLADYQAGLAALDGADLFNLLCIPPDVRGSDTKPEIYSSALDYCVQRRAMLIIDPPHDWDASLVSTAPAKLESIGLSGPKTRNAALYFPRVSAPDPLLQGRPDTFVPCGMVAGAMVATDAQRGVWKAPAGLDAGLNGISGLAIKLTDNQNGQLNPLGINCLRNFPIYGNVVWGARTLRGADQIADEYKYIPVRRLALYIEESLFRGTQWVVFESNDEPLWAQIRLNVGAFMHNLFVKGAFQGQTPAAAYFVKCDKDTTTQNDIDLGIVNIKVGFAPLKPAEFVVLQIQQIAGDIQT